MTFDDAAEDSGATHAPHTPRWLEWIAAQGEIGARVAAFDWSATPLGPIEGWPVAARNAVMLCLGSLFPMTLRLGEERITIYNDACREIYGPERFRDALGRPTSEVWPETAAQLDGILDEVAATGRPFFATDLGLHRTVRCPARSATSPSATRRSSATTTR